MNTSLPFLWSQIESADYRQYVTNLRAVGCPEQVIRDLLVADVNQLFASRANAIWARKGRPYWQKPVDEGPSAEQMTQLIAIGKEKNALLKELLGLRPDEQNFVDTVFVQIPHGLEQELIFLPADKQQAVRDALTASDYDEKFSKSLANDPNHFDPDSLEPDKLRVLATVLSPEEIKEYRLRHSQLAMQLRGELEYFDCTPAEFAALFDLREQQSEKVRISSANLLDRAAAAEEVRQLFGEERAQEFARVTDLFYINARRAAEDQGLPADTAEQAWQITSDTRRLEQKLNTNTTLSEEARKQQLQQLLNGADNNIINLLGEKASRPLRRDLANVCGWRGTIQR